MDDRADPFEDAPEEEYRGAVVQRAVHESPHGFVADFRARPAGRAVWPSATGQGVATEVWATRRFADREAAESWTKSESRATVDAHERPRG